MAATLGGSTAQEKSVFDAGNYRGIHLTAQLSKTVERIVKDLYVPYLTSSVGFGPNQFAYTKGRGARDALAQLVLTWIKTLARGMKIGVYCSDVSGAFDRVSTARLIAKLWSKKLRPEIIEVLSSWLRQRTARVVVGGAQSDAFSLGDMIYQGTVLGPVLWNLFYEDARAALEEWFFQEIVYADDLNAYRDFASSVENAQILGMTQRCQQELHAWGKANQVAFDPTKESMHVLSSSEPAGNNLKLLGLNFDCSLDMNDAIGAVVADAG
jgi:hypothetical protein